MLGARTSLAAVAVLLATCSPGTGTNDDAPAAAPTPTEPSAPDDETGTDRPETPGEQVCGPRVRDAVGQTIAAQLEAFALDDFERAYELASRSYRAGQDVDEFRALIESEFPLLSDGADHRVDDCRDPEQGPVQVRVTVATERAATQEMVYVMVEDPEGWRVAAAGSLEDTGGPDLTV